MQCLFATLALLLAIPAGAFAQSDLSSYFGNNDKYSDVVVEKVLSADTIVIRVDNDDQQIKLIGLRAPEALKKKEDPVERDQYGFEVKKYVNPLTTIEEEAFNYVTEFLTGKHVRLEFDVERSAQDFKTPAYVFMKDDGTFVNEDILRHGYADLQIRPPNTKYADKLRAAYKEARDEKRGIQNR